MNIITAGRNLLYDNAKGVLNTVAVDSEGKEHCVRLPAVIVPGLSKHLFSPVEALLRGASTIFSSNSHINLGNFKVPISGDYGGGLQYISLKVIPKPGAINYSSALSATVISGELMGTGTALVAETVVQQDATENATALTTVGADVWHRRLGHPAEQVMRRLQNISETGVNFEGSLSPCETCKINKSVQPVSYTHLTLPTIYSV